MKLRGLKWRLRLALRALYTDELWDNWVLPHSKDKGFKQQYAEECEAMLHALNPAGRQAMKRWLELKAMYLIRKNGAFDNEKETTINRARLFQVISLKQDIEELEKKEQEEKRDAAEKNRKRR